jgi:hypothetical protein
LIKVLASRVGRVSCEMFAVGAFGADAGCPKLAAAGAAAFCRGSDAIEGAEGGRDVRVETAGEAGSDAARASFRLAHDEHERRAKPRPKVKRVAFR